MLERVEGSRECASRPRHVQTDALIAEAFERPDLAREWFVCLAYVLRARMSDEQIVDELVGALASS